MASGGGRRQAGALLAQNGDVPCLAGQGKTAAEEPILTGGSSISAMVTRLLLGFVVFAAFVNAVPSRAQFHPIKWRGDPVANDMVGSGFEIRDIEALNWSAGCNEPVEHRIARQWRDLARRVRRLAALSSAEEQSRLLALAEQYERRARSWEEQRQPPAAG
jgi:hypothetical protein